MQAAQALVAVLTAGCCRTSLKMSTASVWIPASDPDCWALPKVITMLAHLSAAACAAVDGAVDPGPGSPPGPMVRPRPAGPVKKPYCSASARPTYPHSPYGGANARPVEMRNPIGTSLASFW